ncbi:MAG: helix-turn-helix domain-containing protein [Sphingobium sp.]
MRALYFPYDHAHPVAHAIRTGSGWFDAWQFQHGYGDAALAKATGLAPARIRLLSLGDRVRMSEIDLLAVAYGVQPSDIIASLPDPDLLQQDE